MKVKDLIKKVLVAAVLATALFSMNVVSAATIEGLDKQIQETTQLLIDAQDINTVSEAKFSEGYMDALRAKIIKLNDEKNAVLKAANEPFVGPPQLEPVGETILPNTNKSVVECKLMMNYVAGNRKTVKKDLFIARPDKGLSVKFVDGSESPLFIQDVLGCGIKTGNIKLWMAPYYVRFLLEFALNIAGVLALLGIVIGGYLLLFAGVTEDKEKGKKAIIYAIGGYVMTLVAWAVVNIVISFLTI